MSCAKGKTVIVLAHAASLKAPFIVINNRRQILEQWRLEILGTKFDPPKLGVRKEDIAFLSGPPARWNWQKPIILASMALLARYADKLPAGLSRWPALAVYDEIHHAAAPSYLKTAHLFTGQRVGITATLRRKDGQEGMYKAHIGSVLYRDLSQEIVPQVFVHRSDLELDRDPEDKHFTLFTRRIGTQKDELDHARRIICREVTDGRDILVLSRSVEHLELLRAACEKGFIMSRNLKAEARLDGFKSNKLTFATTSMARDALNKRELDTLVIPVAFAQEEWLQQAVGRILRPKEGKPLPRVHLILHHRIRTISTHGKGLLKLLKLWGAQPQEVKW